jgi:hypothetical protein
MPTGATKLQPINFLEFGRKALLPSDFLLGTLPDKDTVGNSVRNLYERQRLIFDKVRQTISKSQRSQKSYFDNKVKGAVLEE